MEKSNQVKKLAMGYLRSARVAQVATAQDNKPWVCSVYFVADKQANIYWLSYPSRRHSQEISKNEHAAITIVVEQNVPVVALQAEGTVRQVNDMSTLAKIIPMYVKKYGMGKNLLDRIKTGINKHALYKFTPETMVLFDEKNLPLDSAHNVELS